MEVGHREASQVFHCSVIVSHPNQRLWCSCWLEVTSLLVLWWLACRFGGYPAIASNTLVSDYGRDDLVGNLGCYGRH